MKSNNTVSLETKLIAKKMLETHSKADVARKMGVSPRTIGRWIDSISGTSVNEYFGIPLDDGLVNEVEENFVDSQESGEGNGETVTNVEYKVIITNKTISISEITNGVQSGSISVDSSNEMFSEMFNMIVSSGMNQAEIAKAFTLGQPKKMVESVSAGRLFIDIKADRIVFKASEKQDYVLSGLISKRILSTIREKGVQGANILINFAQRLMENPSNKAVNELYGFLEHNDIELAEDGCFYAWKKVRSDYKDIHSGKFDNSPGQHVTMERNMVNENSEDTCSSGLHACAKSYLNHFGGKDSKVVKVKIDPKDVVSIPKDYNNAKMRCCGYKVVEDVTTLFY